MIECTNLSKDYFTPVLRNISVTIATGEYVAVMGPSGSGKSTLLNLMAGMDAPSAGEVRIDGVDLATQREAELAAMRLRAMGFVFQQPNFVRALSILDNIILPGFMAKDQPREAVIARARQLMADLGISDTADKAVTEVSGGQLQRASICRALINEPAMVFGDEPTGALNSTAAHHVMDAVATIHSQGTTVVLVTHDPQVAVRATRVLILGDGEIRDDLALGSYTPEAHQDRLAHVTATLAAHGV